MIGKEEAQAILTDQLHVPRETLTRIAAFVDLLKRENERQNLIPASSVDHIWSRHILDSAQLIQLAPEGAQTWLDLGSGAGFPGLIVAALHPAKVTLIESRKLRVDFLVRAAGLLELPPETRILCARLESVEPRPYDVISARAFAPLGRLFGMAHRFASPRTRWVLPKGKNARVELDDVRTTWQGMFHVEPSLTDPQAGILIAEQVRYKRGENIR